MSSRKEKVDIVGLILKTVGMTGYLTAAVVAPNVLQALAAIEKQKRKFRPDYYIRQTIERLKNRGLLKIEKDESGISNLTLTDRGERELTRYEIGELEIAKPRRWDGKYRVIIFDIAERRRLYRDDLRRWPSELGFYRLQQSVWVHPYDCYEVVTLLKSFFDLKRDVIYMTVDSIENDRWLRSELGLPQRP